jgi:hypothetical protein
MSFSMYKWLSATIPLLLAILLGTVACDESCARELGPTAPPPVTTTVPPDDPPPVIPRVDDWFQWDDFYGYSSFAALRLEDQDIYAMFNQSMGSGWNTPRVCAETEFWPDTDDYPRIPRDIARLRHFLEVTATIPGAQVLLMSNCTLKHGGLVFQPQKLWNRQVAEVAADFKHVAIEVVNEPWHYQHFFHKKWGLVQELISDAKAAGVREVGADDHVCGTNNSVRHEILSSVTFPSFHPCRNITSAPWDPKKGFLERLIDSNGGLAVLSETVAWDDNQDQCDHFLLTCNKERIQSYIDRCNRQPGCKFTFHSEDGLAARIPYSWFPQAH